MGLFCLPMSHKRDARLKRVKKQMPRMNNSHQFTKENLSTVFELNSEDRASAQSIVFTTKGVLKLL